MPGPLGTRGLFVYHSDNLVDYFVEMDATKAEAGGFDPAPESAPGGNYIKGWKMRHVYGEQDDGTRCMLPIASSTNALFVEGGSFSYNGFTYNTRGRIGERRRS